MSGLQESGALLPRHNSVLHALQSHVQHGHPGAVTVAGRNPQTLGLSDLVAAAQRYATVLQSHDVTAGDRVLLGMPTSLHSIVGFLGVQLLKAIPVPVAVLPGGGRNSTRHMIESFSRYLRPRVIVVPHDIATALDAEAEGLPAPVLDGDELFRRGCHHGSAAVSFQLPEPDDAAFIQCTSGSTGTPKGVVVTHANVAANCEQITTFAEWTTEDVWTGWLPLYHDMGLIGGLLTPLYAGSSAVMIPPARFLRNPLEWIRAICDYGGTISATPNFGLSYASRRIDDAALGGIDLSALRTIFCGAEPISQHTVRTFVTKFAPCGLPADAVVPCYGLAEATLIVTAARPGKTLSFDVVSRQAMATEGVARDTPAGDSDAQEVVDVGEPVRGTEIRVVDDGDRPVPDSVLGRVQFRGPARTDGYFELPEVSASCLKPGGWWNTGDIGYLRNGRLRITGRERDLIVIRGANYFPQDFERAAESSTGVVAGAVVAVGHRDQVDGTEQLCLIVESDVSAEQHAGLAQALRASVTGRTGVAVSQVRVVPRGALPKTTSGKLQRALAYQRFVAGEEGTRTIDTAVASSALTPSVVTTTRPA